MDDIVGWTTGRAGVYTAFYQAPEILWEYIQKPTEQTDVYALGCVFLEVSHIYSIF